MVRSCVALMSAMAMVTATLGHAQTPVTIDSTMSMSPAPGRSSWAHSFELGIFPTAQHYTPDLGQPALWGGGLTATLAYHLTSFLALEVAGPVTINPDLNGIDRTTPNFYSATGSLVLQVPTSSTVQPYVLAGGGYDWYVFRAPVPLGVADHLSYDVAHAGVGVRFRLSRTAALRAEATTDVGRYRPAEMGFLGISFFPGSHRAPPRIERIVVTKQLRQRVDTLNVTDTLRITTRTTDTVSVTRVRTQVDTNVILVLQDVNFGFGHSTLRPGALPVLSRLALELNAPALAGVPIEIRGYTDSVGSDSANYRLGLARGTAVRDQLIRDGVDPNRLTVTSGGKSDPLESNATEEGRARNRRVVIRRRTPTS